MKRISFLTVPCLLIFCLVLVGMFAIPREIEAGTAASEPVFTINDLVISPKEAKIGQTITISATVKETNNITGVYEGTLKINGTVEETQSISIRPKASKPVTFAVSRNEAGVYSVDLDGLTGSFTVTVETISGSSDSSFPTVPIVVGIIAAVVVVALLIFFLSKRRAT